MNNQKHRGYIYGRLNHTQEISKERRKAASTFFSSAITAVKSVARKVKEFFTGDKEMFVSCSECKAKNETLYKYKGKHYCWRHGAEIGGQAFISRMQLMTSHQRREVGIA